MKKVYYVDMDGVIANFHKAYAEDKGIAFKKDAMENLEPFSVNVQVVKDLIRNNNKVYILTKVARDYIKEAKINWLKKYIPEIDPENVICITKGRKIDYIQESGMLIDDDKKNIKPWRKAGHPYYWVEEKGAPINIIFE